MVAHSIFEAAKLVRARHAPAAAGQGEASGRSDTEKVTKTIVRNRGRVAGNYEKTRSSYSSLQPNSIDWTSEADWRACRYIADLRMIGGGSQVLL